MNNPFPSLSRLKEICSIDFHIMTTLLFRGWGVLAGGITIILLPIWLSPSEQGFYFTFASVLGIQVFFELGLNQIVLQLVSHEIIHLHEDESGQLTGHAAHLDRVASIVALTNRWYAIAAILFAIVCGVSGIVLFHQKELDLGVTWPHIWVILVAITSINLWISPKLAVMEGFGKVGHVARLRLMQSVIGYAVFWLALYLGAGLWVAFLLPLVAAVFSSYWLRFRAPQLRALSLRKYSFENQVNWRADILPLQWRIGLSWASGYLIFSLFTPMVFVNQGDIAAGQLGIALAIFASISTIGMSWISAKVPNFVTLIAHGQRKALDLLFNQLLVRSTILITICCIGFLVVLQYLTYIDLSIVHRIAPLEVLVILAITTIVNSLIFGMASYMRAHREEPMLAPSMIVGLLTALAVYFGSKYGVLMMMFMYMLIVIFVSLPWTVFLFLTYYKNKK